MVQRKVASKLGIQADNIKPSSEHQDGKNRGADLPKKIKKLRSMKHSDIESLCSSSPSRSCKPQPGKPPTHDVPMTEVTPQRQPLNKKAEGSPNYMKSTSCSAARKDSKDSSRKSSNSSNSKLTFGSGNKPAVLIRTSSLKRVRTLTKTPSFKSRTTSVKCSEVALCGDTNSKRVTCSSTQKDSKFPPYLMLHPGGTESEGPSVIKVCPFNYCSLNGHHRDPLPPLRCFLKAKRSSMKAQKSMMLEALNKPRVKLSGKKKNQIDNGDVLFDERPAYKEVDESVDFFVEIYAYNKEDDVEAIGGSMQGEELLPYGAGFEQTEEFDDDRQFTKSLSDESPLSEIDAEDNFGDYNGISTEMDSGEHKIDEEYPSSWAEEDATPGSFCSGIGLEGECHGSFEYDAESEAINMEWEEGQFSSLEIDIETHNSVKTEDGFDDNTEYSSKTKNPDLQDGPVMISYDMMSNCYEEILDAEVMQEVFEEESGISERQSNDDSDSEQDVAHQIVESHGSTQMFDILSKDQLPCTEEPFEDLPTMAEKSGQAETELIDFVISSTSTEKPIPEPTAATEEAQGNIRDHDAQNEISEMSLEANSTPEANDEPLSSHQENNSLQDEDNEGASIFEVECIASQGFTESFQVETNEQQNGSQKIEESETEPNVGISDFSVGQDLPNDDAGEVKEEKDCKFSEEKDCQFSEEKTATESINFVITSSSTEERILEPTAVAKEAQGNSRDHDAQNETTEVKLEANSTFEDNDEPLNTHQENNPLPDEDNVSTWLFKIFCTASQGFTETFQVETNEQQNGSQKIEESETEPNVGISVFSLKEDLPNDDDAGEEMEEKDCKVSEDQLRAGIQTSQDFSEAEKLIIKVDETESHRTLDPCLLDNIAEDGQNTSQETIDESLSAVTSFLSSYFSLEQDIPNDDAGDGMEEHDCQVSDSKLLVGIQISQDFSNLEQVIIEVDDTESHRTLDACQLNNNAGESSNTSQESIGESLSSVTGDQLSGEEYKRMTVVENESFMKTSQDEAEKSKISSSMDSDQSDSKTKSLSSGENCIGEVDRMEMEDKRDTDAADASGISSNKTSQELERTFFNSRNTPNKEQLDACNNRKWTIGCRKPINDYDEQSEFNPREPNYLPMVPDPQGEKVDLRHQMMDDRKNAEEWMLDFALRKAVNKLAPARKKKVALLVEAFETVTPILKYEPSRRHTSAAITHARPIQACN